MEKLYKNKEWLYENYITLGKSMQEIADKCECCIATISRWLKIFGIQVRSLSEAQKLKYKNGYINPNKDKIFSPEIRKTMSEARKLLFKNGYINPHKGKFGENHPTWKGDKAGIKSIHQWITRHKPKPEDGKCKLCGKVVDEKGISELELSFINHSKKYTRNPEDYQYTHHTCHMYYDIEHGSFKRKKKNNIV